MDKIKVAIIGAGGISGAHADPYSKNENVNFKAVADLDEAKAKELGEKYGVNSYKSIDEMFDKEELDGVSICTPPGSHRFLVENIAPRGVHMFCEKPLANTSEDAAAMDLCAKDNNVILMVAMCHRFHEPVVQIKQKIEEGALGDIVSFRNRFQYLTTTDMDLIRARGGVLLDNGSHSVDLIRFLAGNIDEVSAVFSDGVSEINELRALDITLRTKTNGIGTIELDGRSSGDSGMNIVEVYGTKGMGCISYNDMVPSYWRTDDDGVTEIAMPEDGAHRFGREIAHFVNCVKGDEENILPASEGTEDLKVIEAVFKAGAEEKVISVN